MMHKFSLEAMQRIAFHMDKCPDESPMNHNVSSPLDIPIIYSLITYRKGKSPLLIDQIFLRIT